MKHLKKIIKVASTHPERIVLWLFLTVLVAMSSYLIMRWRAKEPPGDLIPAARQLPEIPVLVGFGDLLREEGSYRKGFLRDPFSHQPLVPDPVLDPDPDPDPEPEPEPEPKPIIREPLPRVSGMRIIGDRREVLIRIGRETYWVTGGESINGWEVLNIGEKSIALYNEKRGERLILLFRK